MNNGLSTILATIEGDGGLTWKYVGFRGGWPWWLLVALLVVACGFAVALYASESSLSRGRRALLGGLRTITFGMVLFFLFAPLLGLERTQNIRPNLLVLTDRSSSMAIADPRRSPEERLDAALATGAAKFVHPDEQAAVARARRAAENALAALKSSAWHDVVTAQSELQSALTAPTEKGGSTPLRPESPRPEKFAAAIQAIARHQTELQTRIAQRPRDTTTPAATVAEYRQAQEAIRRELDTLAADLAAASAVTGATAADASPVTRSAMARGLLRREELGQLGRECAVRYFAFGDTLEEIALGNAPDGTIPALQPTDKATHGAQALRDAVAKHAHEPIAGVVLLSDGAFNDELPQPMATAGWLKELGIPLYPVGLGLQSPPDVRLRTLLAQDVLFPKDLVTVRAQVSGAGYAGVRTEISAALDGNVVAKRAVELTEEPQFVDLTFRAPENQGGTRKLTVSVPAQPGEISTDNNHLEKPLRIIDQKIKVLFVEGRPRWEYRYLRVLLQRDPRLDVKFLMTQGDPDLPSGSNEYLAKYPEKADEAFSHDLIILGDVPKFYFNQQQLERMVELVRDRGGSLLMLAGEQYAPASYVDSPIAELLPVRTTRDYLTVPESTHPLPTALGKTSFALLDESDAANMAAWKLVGSLHKVPRLEGAKPGASVLLELPEGPNRPEPYPLVAWQYVGSGKVMYVGTDQLWRLRFKLGDRYHARFWGQAIQFLALSRLLGENKRVRIEVDNADKIHVGERVEIHANALDPAYRPVVADKYAIQWTSETSGPGESAAAGTIDLTPVPGSPGLFQGSHVFRTKGQFRLQAPPVDARFANSVDVNVASADLESLEPAMQEAQLRKMASLSGGRYFTVRDWPALPGVVQARARVQVETKELDLWDRWPLFVLFLATAGLEWFLRRRFNLV